MPSNVTLKGEGSTLQEPDTIMNSEVQHLQAVLQSTGSSPPAEGQQAVPQQRGELTTESGAPGGCKDRGGYLEILSYMEELAMLCLEGRKRYGRQAATPCSGASLWSQDHTKSVIPSTDTRGIRAFVWIQWCQDTKQQGCNFTEWLQESCSIPGQGCPCTNAPCRAQGSLDLSHWAPAPWCSCQGCCCRHRASCAVCLRAVTPCPSEQGGVRQRKPLRALLLSLHGDFCVTNAKS